jgi:hypothetical protein
MYIIKYMSYGYISKAVFSQDKTIREILNALYIIDCIMQLVTNFADLFCIYPQPIILEKKKLDQRLWQILF